MGMTIEEYREAHPDYNRHLGAAAEVAKPDPKEEANAMLIGRMSWHVRWLQCYKLLYLFYSHPDTDEAAAQAHKTVKATTSCLTHLSQVIKSGKLVSPYSRDVVLNISRFLFHRAFFFLPSCACMHITHV